MSTTYTTEEMSPLANTIIARAKAAIPDVQIMAVTFPTFWAGHLIQLSPFWPIPRIIRHHLTNCVDTPEIAVSLSIPIILTTGRVMPKTLATLVASVGIYHKYEQSHKTGRPLDNVDCGLFVAGAFAYVAVRNHLTKRQARKQALANKAG